MVNGLKCIDNINYKVIKCSCCKTYYHSRCIVGNLNDSHWMCFTCTGEIFPFNHILEDDEFMYSLQYFHNSVEYNNFLELKFNPYLFEIGIDNNSSCEHLQKLLLLIPVIMCLILM